MGLKYKFRKAEDIIRASGHEERNTLDEICSEIRDAEDNLLKKAEKVLSECKEECRGLCCRNIHPDEIITLPDAVYIMNMNRKELMKDRISACLKREIFFFSSPCVFLENGEGPCIFPPDVRPERCIITFCQDETPIKKEIRLVRSKFDRLSGFIRFRKLRELKQCLLNFMRISVSS